MKTIHYLDLMQRTTHEGVKFGWSDRPGEEFASKEEAIAARPDVVRSVTEIETFSKSY